MTTDSNTEYSSIYVNGKEYQLVQNMRFMMLSERYFAHRRMEEEIDVEQAEAEVLAMLKAGMKPFHDPEDAEYLFDMVSMTSLLQFMGFGDDGSSIAEEQEEVEEVETIETDDFLPSDGESI